MLVERGTARRRAENAGHKYGVQIVLLVGGRAKGSMYSYSLSYDPRMVFSARLGESEATVVLTVWVVYIPYGIDQNSEDLTRLGN